MEDKLQPKEGNGRNYDRFAWKADDIRIIKPLSEEVDNNDDVSEQASDDRSVVEMQKKEILDILLSKRFKNDELQKIIALANLIGGPDGDDAITETMYAYVTGIADWQAHYAEFFSRKPQSE
jgi:hypothetical protein